MRRLSEAVARVNAHVAQRVAGRPRGRPRGYQKGILKVPGMLCTRRFSEAVARVNAHVAQYVAARPRGRVAFLDCGEALLAPGGGALDAQLVPDSVQPNAAGGCPALRVLHS